MATIDQRIPDMIPDAVRNDTLNSARGDDLLATEEPASKPDDVSLYDDAGIYVYFLNDYSYPSSSESDAPAHFMASPAQGGGHMTVLEDYAVESSEPTPL